MIEYRGYTGVFEYDDEYEFFSGHVVDTRDGINFEGSSVAELKESMRCAIDDYLEFCEDTGRAPSKPYSGRIWSALTAPTSAPVPPAPPHKPPAPSPAPSPAAWASRRRRSSRPGSLPA